MVSLHDNSVGWGMFILTSCCCLFGGWGGVAVCSRTLEEGHLFYLPAILNQALMKYLLDSFVMDSLNKQGTLLTCD